MGLQKQAAHRNIWWIGTPCPTFCSTSPRSVLCWAALHPFIFIKKCASELIYLFRKYLPSTSGCERQWPSVFIHKWITKVLCWNPLWVSSLWVAHDALNVYQVISFMALDAALPRLHLRKQGREDYVVRWLDWSMVWAPLRMTPKLLLLQLSFASPIEILFGQRSQARGSQMLLSMRCKLHV